MGGYLKRIGTVKYSHSWPAKGSPPRNPDEDAYREKKVILHQSGFVFTIFSMSHWWFFPPISSVSSSLGWCLPDYLDAMLLELGSEERIFILQLFNLKKNRVQQKRIKHLFISMLQIYFAEIS